MALFQAVFQQPVTASFVSRRFDFFANTVYTGTVPTNSKCVLSGHHSDSLPRETGITCKTETEPVAVVSDHRFEYLARNTGISCVAPSSRTVGRLYLPDAQHTFTADAGVKFNPIEIKSSRSSSTHRTSSALLHTLESISTETCLVDMEVQKPVIKTSRSLFRHDAVTTSTDLYGVVRAKYIISNHPGAGYTCQINVNWSDGMSKDFSDIRFSDGNGLSIPYFVGDYEDGINATVWIKLSASSTVYMTYGTGGTSQSDGNSVFEFFDHFDGSNYDPTRWGVCQINGGKVTVSNSECSISGVLTLYSKTKFATGYTFGMKIKSNCWNNSAYTTRYGWGFNDGGGSVPYIFFFPCHTTSQFALAFAQNTGTEVITYPSSDATTANTYNLVEIKKSATKPYLYYDNVLKATGSTSYYPTGTTAACIGVQTGAGLVTCDYIFVRKYVAVEPVATLDYVLKPASQGMPVAAFLGFGRNLFVESNISVPVLCEKGQATQTRQSSVSVRHPELFIRTNNPRYPKVAVTPPSELGFANRFPWLPTVDYNSTLPYAQWKQMVTYQIKYYPGDGYVVAFEIDWKPGMRGDFRDIRFSDGTGVELNYYHALNETRNFNSVKVYVRLGKSSIVRMHYHNPIAVSESNGDKTFDFFDDFTGADVDWVNKWYRYGIIYTLSDPDPGKTLTVCGNGGTSPGNNLRARKAFGPGWIFGARMKTNRWDTTTGKTWMGFAFPNGAVNNYTQSIYFAFNAESTYNKSLVQKISDWSKDVFTTDSSVWSAYTYGLVEVVRTLSSSQVRINGTVRQQATDTLNYPTGDLYPFFMSYNQGDVQTIDYCFVRKCAAVEPVPVLMSASTVDSQYMEKIGTLGATIHGRDGLLELPAVQEGVQRSFHYIRDAGIKLPTVSNNSTRNKAFFRSVTNFVGIENGKLCLEFIQSLEMGRIAEIGVQNLYENAWKGYAYFRDSSHTISAVETSGEREKQFSRHAEVTVRIIETADGRALESVRESGVGTIILRTFDRRAFHGVRFVDNKIPTSKELGQRITHCGREASNNVLIVLHEDARRSLHSLRLSDIPAPKSNEKTTLRFNSWRYDYYNTGFYVPVPECSVAVISHNGVHADLLISTPALLVERLYGIGVRSSRQSSAFLDISSVLTKLKASLIRDAQAELPVVEVEANPGSGRTARVNVSPVETKASRQINNCMDVLLEAGRVGLSARYGAEIYRDSEIEILPVIVDTSRTGTFNRAASSSVVIVDTEGSGEGLIERIAEIYTDSLYVSSDRILDAVRESALEMSEPCVLTVGVVNYDHLFEPYEIDVEKPDYLITVDKPEYGLELDKNFYYAIVRDGENMIEITQFDTDTFYADLQDTDPVTKNLRPMPLDGKTVKVVLKGGAPDTTVTVDCVVIEDGKVKFDLKSSDTAISGRYVLKYVILSEGYRKEVPENREEYQEVQINDALYSNAL